MPGPLQLIFVTGLLVGGCWAVQHSHHARFGDHASSETDATSPGSGTSRSTSIGFSGSSTATSLGLQQSTSSSLEASLIVTQISQPYTTTPRKLSRKLAANAKARKRAAVTGVPRPIRGVNIGSWLILEPWMVENAMITPLLPKTAVDQWTFDMLAAENATVRSMLVNHWNTFFTEEDVQNIKRWGLNTIRIPIGYWAYKHYNSDPFFSGADEYLERAIGWCTTHGLKVIIDLHGAPGSQNGAEHSGHQGAIDWYNDNNMIKTIAVLKQITKKYTRRVFWATVIGIELTNEPSGDYNVIQQWAVKAYKAVETASSNPNLIILMHDGWFNPTNWRQIGTQLNGKSATINNARFWIDSHLYQNEGQNIPIQNQATHIGRVCDWATGVFLPKDVPLPVIVGEFSAQTHICAYPNGTNVGGNDCNVPGCQCGVWAQPADYKAPLKQAVRKYLEAELDVFEAHSKGWILWSYKAEPGVWSLVDLVTYGVMPQPITSRQYGHQC